MKLLTNISVIILLSLASVYASEPDEPVADSLNISEVEITMDRKSYYSTEYHSYKIETEYIRQNLSLDLGELLGRLAALNIKSYGSPGSLSTVSMRGSSSSQTQVNWNGFTLNSPANGIADLSVIPVFLFDDISVIHGGSGSIYGSGAFGGVINLGPGKVEKTGTSLILSLDVGSNSYYNGGFRLKTAGKKLRYSLAAFMMDAENDFLYTDRMMGDEPVLRRKHNQSGSMGIMQDIGIKLKKGNSLHFGNWYNVKDKNIPAIEGRMGESGQEQADSSFKVFASWKKTGRRSGLELRGAYFYDYQRYTDKLVSGEYLVFSEIITGKLLADANYRFYFDGGINMELGANISQLRGDVVAYGKNVRENEGNIITAVSRKGEELDMSASIRLNMNEYETPPPLCSVSATYKFSDSYRIRGNVSTKYRLPTLNDKYWQPGGDPSLDPEKGWGADFGVIANLVPDGGKSNVFKAEMTLFSMLVNNQIQWVPGGSYYMPVNNEKVWSRGLESSLNYTVDTRGYLLGVSFDHAYTIATLSTGADLIYNPRHIVRARLDQSYSFLFASLETSYTSRRFTTTDNDAFYSLDPYLLINASLGIKNSGSGNGSVLKLGINNLLNTEYRLMPAYPVPGRSFTLSFIMNINNNLE